MCVMCPEGTFSYGTRRDALSRKPPRPLVIKGIGVPSVRNHKQTKREYELKDYGWAVTNGFIIGRNDKVITQQTNRDPDDEVYPPQRNPKPISLEWEDIEYKPPTY